MDIINIVDNFCFFLLLSILLILVNLFSHLLVLTWREVEVKKYMEEKI